MTTKWKRDRRSRLPEYSRKSDPKIPEVFNQLEQQDVVSPGNGVAGGDEKYVNGEQTANKDIPLDMSIRHRGQPPSYAQTISNPGYRSSYRPSVIQNSVPSRDDIPSGNLSFKKRDKGIAFSLNANIIILYIILFFIAKYFSSSS